MDLYNWDYTNNIKKNLMNPDNSSLSSGSCQGSRPYICASFLREGKIFNIITFLFVRVPIVVKCLTMLAGNTSHLPLLHLSILNNLSCQSYTHLAQLIVLQQLSGRFYICILISTLLFVSM